MCLEICRIRHGITSPFAPAAAKLPHRRPIHYPVIIMTAIVDVRIATKNNSTITAMELLEEFADSTPSWSYLEDDTRYYSESRGCPACVLSHVHYHPFETVDFAFAAEEQKEGGPVHLMLVEATDTSQSIELEDRDRLVREFIKAFEGYAESGNVPVEVTASESEVA